MSEEAASQSTVSFEGIMQLFAEVKLRPELDASRHSSGRPYFIFEALRERPAYAAVFVIRTFTVQGKIARKSGILLRTQ